MGEPKKSKSLLKQAVMQVGAGGSAGFVEVCIMHPLDLIKTRLQMQRIPPGTIVTANDPTVYSGIGDCFRKMYKHEGFFAFWKGVLPPILAETPKRAVKFFTFEQYKQFLLFGSPTPTPLTFSLAGLGAGITEAILVNPFEVVKVTMQTNKAHRKEAPSTWQVTREIVRTQVRDLAQYCWRYWGAKYDCVFLEEYPYSFKGLGLRGLNKGITATIARNAVFNMFYFGFYHSVKGVVPTPKDPIQEFGLKCGIGFLSGSFASCLNIPFDVAKSRIQGPQPKPGVVTYSKTLQTVYMVYTQEGWRALYKGLLPKVMRLGPGGAIMLVVYDYVYEFLTDRFPD